MIDINGLISQAFNTIENTVPDAVINGKLVKYTKTYNRLTSKYDVIESDSQDVKCVFESIEELFRTSENTDSIVSKIHVFGLLPKPVDMFDELQLVIDSSTQTFKTDKLKKINVGESSVLHTFIVTR